MIKQKYKIYFIFSEFFILKNSFIPQFKMFKTPARKEKNQGNYYHMQSYF